MWWVNWWLVQCVPHLPPPSDPEEIKLVYLWTRVDVRYVITSLPQSHLSEWQSSRSPGTSVWKTNLCCHVQMLRKNKSYLFTPFLTALSWSFTFIWTFTTVMSHISDSIGKTRPVAVQSNHSMVTPGRFASVLYVFHSLIIFLIVHWTALNLAQ